jgi:hypothetical protein
VKRLREVACDHGSQWARDTLEACSRIEALEAAIRKTLDGFVLEGGFSLAHLRRVLKGKS